MPLNITYTCNWCNQTHHMEMVKTPPNWIQHPVHNPTNQGVEEGYFCQESCKNHWDQFEPKAQESAKEHYKNEFYSFMNKMKADVRDRPKLEAR